LDDVGVGVEGDPDARVAESLLDDLGVDSGGQCQGRRRVPEVVQPDQREVGAGHEPPERHHDVVRVQRPPVRIGEDRTGFGPTIADQLPLRS